MNKAETVMNTKHTPGPLDLVEFCALQTYGYICIVNEDWPWGAPVKWIRARNLELCDHAINYHADYLSVLSARAAIAKVEQS